MPTRNTLGLHALLSHLCLVRLLNILYIGVEREHTGQIRESMYIGLDETKERK